jgi:hypothetical protein
MLDKYAAIKSICISVIFYEQCCGFAISALIWDIHTSNWTGLCSSSNRNEGFL